jgi:deoxycytidylate deaminase
MSKRQEVTAITYDKRGRILSIGKNSYVNTHTIQAKYARKAGLPDAVYIHAEIDALIRARGRQIHKILVIRYGADGKPANAKPCKICQLALKDYNVKHIQHT